jgi:hypothetical protein
MLYNRFPTTYLEDWANRLAPNVPKVLIKNGANPNDLKEKFTQDEVEEMKIKLGKKMGTFF